jgi:polyribonucleotide nucleotidyltransferase
MVVYISWKNRNFASPKEDVKTYAPKILQEEFHSFIGALIGPGGKVIQELQKTTGTTIVINEDPITEEGVIEILGTDPAGIEAVQN